VSGHGLIVLQGWDNPAVWSAALYSTHLYVEARETVPTEFVIGAVRRVLFSTFSKISVMV